MDSAWMGWLKKLAAVAFAAAVIWVIGWGYWHFKISTAIDALDSGAKREPVGKEPPFLIPQETANEIQDAGTRALPHLVNSLTPKRNVAYLLVAGEWVRKWLVEKDPTLHLRPFHLDDQPDDVEAKCEEHQAAWKRVGAPRHRGWMWWKMEELPPQLYPQSYIR
jgi:hypothetical protein